MGRKDFHAHLESVLKEGKDGGMLIEFIAPVDCSSEQMNHLRIIVMERESDAVTVFKAEGFTFMAYDDPRFPSQISYLMWTDEGWATPKGDQQKVLIKLDRRGN